MKKISLLLSFCYISLFLSAQNQDCITAQHLLTKDSIFVNANLGNGNVVDDYNTMCSEGTFSLEWSSSWYYFDVYQSGTMTFVATPNLPNEDLDFFLFKAVDSTNCDGLESYICNTSCLLYTSPSPRDRQKSRMPSSA